MRCLFLCSNTHLLSHASSPGARGGGRGGRSPFHSRFSEALTSLPDRFTSLGLGFLV